MENPVSLDLVVLLFVYWDILNTNDNRNMRSKGFADLKDLFFNKMKRNEDFFMKNDVLVEDYKFICQVIEYLENCRNKQVLKK